MNNSRPFDTSFDTFSAEIEEVQSTLLASTTDLLNPLGDLVRGQIKRSQPPICAAVVLTVSKPHGGITVDGDLRRKRIVLAAALEMLHVALNVHRLLVNAALDAHKEGGEAEVDRAFIGSTILAGDFCFSRAAQLAAQTDNPRVVATFSLALQIVSEELLREQFDPENEQYDETAQILQSGAEAASQLVNLSQAEQDAAIRFSQELASHWSLNQQPSYAIHATDGYMDGYIANASAHGVPSNWQMLYHWLNHQRTNGEVAPLPY